MSAELVGPLTPVWFSWPEGRRFYDLPKSTLDIRYSACADHHPACDCREASIAESFAEHKAEFDALYSAVLAATDGHQTYAWTADGYRDEFAECKCPACGIARKARVGYWRCKDQRQAAAEQVRREAWKRAHGATLAPVYPYHDLVELPF